MGKAGKQSPPRSGIVQPLIRACISVVVLVITLAGCSLQQDLASQVAGKVSGEVSPSPAPNIRGVGLNGEHIDLATFSGHPVVIDFWGSWCGPCRKEQPELNSQAATYMPKGVEYLGVDMRDDDASARAYIQDFHVLYPSIADADAKIAGEFSVDAPPTILVIDQRGQIRARYFGTLSGISRILDKLLS